MTAGLLARVDHLLTFPSGDLHRFFTEHVFASLGRLDGMLGMEGIGSNDIYHVNIRIIRQALHVVVVVDIAVREVILRLPASGLGGGARNDASEAAIFGFLQGRGQLLRAQCPQTNQGDAEFPCGVDRACWLGKKTGQWKGGGGQSRGLQKGAASGQWTVHGGKI